jgi:hypothetical protein
MVCNRSPGRRALVVAAGPRIVRASYRWHSLDDPGCGLAIRAGELVDVVSLNSAAFDPVPARHRV